ncbi:MAG: hypothetical protein AAF938_10480 [Myxococcota bacterium]
MISGDVIFDNSHSCYVSGVMAIAPGDTAVTVYHRGQGRRSHAVVFPEGAAESGTPGWWYLRVPQVWEHSSGTWNAFVRVDGAIVCENGPPPLLLSQAMMDHGDVIWNIGSGPEVGWRFNKLSAGSWIPF